MQAPLYKWLSITQGFYFLLTALWPLVDITSFMQITGPKTDIWLVNTVAVLLIPIALCFLAGAVLPAESPFVILIGLTTSPGLAFIDIYYTSNDVIEWVYLIDGGLELLFFSLWVVLAVRALRDHRRHTLHRIQTLERNDPRV
jgi:hypothetical protein